MLLGAQFVEHFSGVSRVPVRSVVFRMFCFSSPTIFARARCALSCLTPFPTPVVQWNAELGSVGDQKGALAKILSHISHLIRVDLVGLSLDAWVIDLLSPGLLVW